MVGCVAGEVFGRVVRSSRGARAAAEGGARGGEEAHLCGGRAAEAGRAAPGTAGTHLHSEGQQGRRQSGRVARKDHRRQTAATQGY